MKLGRKDTYNYKMKTQKEIDAEIALLRTMKPNVRRTTAFGADNWAAIEAQIRVLEENISGNYIWDNWPYESGSDMMLRECAEEAINWRDHDDVKPSDEWKSLWTPPEPTVKQTKKPTKAKAKK